MYKGKVDSRLSYDGLNWTKVGLKYLYIMYYYFSIQCLNWTKVGLKLFSKG